jgi:hypothetical protein
MEGIRFEGSKNRGHMEDGMEREHRFPSLLSSLVFKGATPALIMAFCVVASTDRKPIFK